MAQIISRFLDLKPFRMRVDPIIKLFLGHAFGFRFFHQATMLMSVCVPIMLRTFKYFAGILNGS